MRWHHLLLCLAAPVAAVAQTGSSGASACAQCHSQAKSQPSTSMGRALETVEDCKVLIDHPVLTATVGKYSYRIERQGNQASYSVSDGTNSISMPIRWAMGASSAIGQTYILEKDGELYESRVSYFRELQGLGPTIGVRGICTGRLEGSRRAINEPRGQARLLRVPRYRCNAGKATHPGESETRSAM